VNTHIRKAGRSKALLALASIAVAAATLSACGGGGGGSSTISTNTGPTVAKPTTPIQHVVVIFQENVSFDHYFGTYPTATNPIGEPAFKAASGTPVANTLATPLNVTSGFTALTSVNLLTANPNSTNAGNAPNNINPFRLDRSQAATADQDHDYTPEQQAFDNTAMDLFPSSLGTGNSAAPESLTPPLNTAGLVMGYYDGNTVTALWNYAQHYAMNDNSFGTMFGPSSVGAINLVSGQTNGVTATNAAVSGSGTNIDGEISSDGNGGIGVTGDPQPLGDACDSRDAVSLGGKNIGDLLNAANVTWGFFQGGFDLTVTNSNGTTGCKRSTVSAVTGQTKTDYIPHHQPFQYYKTTQNLAHARPSAVAAIGNSYEADGKTLDPANHQYDIHDFFDAVSAGNFPSISFLKAPGYQDSHAGYSDPLDEQEFVTGVINFLQKQPSWSSTLVIIAFDDSDGWYDHQASPIVNPSLLTAALANVTSNGLTVAGNADAINGPGVCNTGVQQGSATPATPLPGVSGSAGVYGRCGHGPRLPFLVISPFAKVNYIDHTMIDQSSIIRFIEDNWLASQRIPGSFDAIAGTITNMLNFTSGAAAAPTLQLDPASGEPLPCTNCS
jgi:phospholipase C